MHLNNQTKQDLIELLEEVKMQDEAFANLKLKTNLRVISLEIQKAFALFEASAQHLETFARQADLKGMRGVVHSRQVLIEFVIKKATPLHAV